MWCLGVNWINGVVNVPITSLRNASEVAVASGGRNANGSRGRCVDARPACDCDLGLRVGVVTVDRGGHRTLGSGAS